MPSDPHSPGHDHHDSEGARERTYHAPQLSCLGSLAELTQTSASGPDTDGGGSFPNIYTS
jgi:hypothetical protein